MKMWNLLLLIIYGFTTVSSILNSDNLEELLRLGLHNILKGYLYDDVPQQNASYDFIIVGAGPAGCVLANRLSENPKWQVYLIEAGGTENLMHQIPALTGFLQGTHSNWGYKSEPQQSACFGMYNNQCSLPRGKILGGTSSINFMIYNRGNKHDFNKWSQGSSKKGWSYKDVLPYFLKSENAQLEGLEESFYHNHSGPLSIEYVGYRSTMAKAFVKAAQEAGHEYTDYNGESQMGVSYVQATIQNGRRHSAFKSYIEPIRYLRRNLHILTLARVTKILIKPNSLKAYGVEMLYRNIYYTILARKEVILAAGTFHSPQLLMLSGIGPTELLEDIGVPVIKDLPVGQILFDHMCHLGPTFITNTTDQSIFSANVDPNVLSSFLRGQANTKLSSIGGVEALTFIKVPGSEELEEDLPDVELLFTAGSLASDEGTALTQTANIYSEIYRDVYKTLATAQQDHFTILVMQFHPKSKGRLWLNSKNPMDGPRIDPKYFENDEDVDILLKGIREAIRISKMPAMQKIGTRLHRIPVNGCEEYSFNSDEYWRCSIRVLSYTLHHQVATCRMGSKKDNTSVVNRQLKVHGIKGLRVADTSVIPYPPTAHTNAASFMIGEKAADMIRTAWS